MLERRTRARPGFSGRRKWLLKAILLCCVAGLVKVYPQASQGISISTKRTKSPPLEVHTVEGKVVQVSSLPGKVVLIDIMSTTCPSCKLASEGIQKLYQQLGGKGFLPVAIAVDQRAPNLLAFYRNVYQLTFPIGVTSREDILGYLKITPNRPLYVPTLVLLDKRGRTCATQVGWTGQEELRAAITKLLAERM